MCNMKQETGLYPTQRECTYCGNCLSVCRQDVSNNLTLAVAPDDFKDESQLDANDFLIRGIIGMDPKGGAMAVGGAVGVGKRIRFMVGCQPRAAHIHTHTDRHTHSLGMIACQQCSHLATLHRL